jgi:cytochrome b subunit of formate dehydrogenase
MMIGFLIHILYLLITFDWKRFPKVLWGPDSLVPRPKDFVDFFKHVGWFLGLSQLPRFDRWGYWEKFDYWAVFWGIPLLGLTGLALAYPLISTRVLPGWGLNVAFWIHRIEALLAMAHVFIIHFFIAHLRRHNFPMDRAMFEGSADLDAAQHERPAWIERLRDSGDLERVLVPATGTGSRIVYYVFGYAAVAAGVFLLVGALINTPYITW